MAPFPKPKSFYELLESWRQALTHATRNYAGEGAAELQSFIQKLDELCAPRRTQYPNWPFDFTEVEQLLSLGKSTYVALGGAAASIQLSDADIPVPFDLDSLEVAAQAAAEILGVSEHTSTLQMRIGSLIRNNRIRSILETSTSGSLEDWLELYLGPIDSKKCTITIIDLSLVPDEILHLSVSVIARIVFEALQRYRKSNQESLPTVLIMEEAHNFVHAYLEHSADYSMARTSSEVFERIAREGRKFGLGLVISSQRPSELSATVLSQCNSFLIHRVTNDRDQELLSRLVPDNLRGMLRQLPILPAQHAFLMGWASEIPTLARIDDLPPELQPRSSDPAFWNAWTDPTSNGMSWSDIATDWREPSRPSRP